MFNGNSDSRLIRLLLLLPLLAWLAVPAQADQREQRHGLRNAIRGHPAQPSPDPKGADYTKHQLEFYLDKSMVTFVRPGLQLSIQDAAIGADLKLTVTFSIADDRGLPLDRLGIFTPGEVSTSFVAAYIPQGQSQYVAHTTRVQTSPITSVSENQASSDRGGSYQQVADGVYTYTFGTTLPADYDRTTTHTIGIYARRDLEEFELGIQDVNAEFSWVPDGSPVTRIRDVVRTETCNKCHDPLAIHGGRRRNVLLCVLCHQPQSVDPDTGNTVDMKVMIHKIHYGPNLPSVQAGTPYQIIGFRQSVHDYSHVTYPQEPNHCQSCHDGSAIQSINWLTKPTRATCGSCHDGINWATGEGHRNLAQPNDADCARCHQPQGEFEFDPSIMGSHTVPRFSRNLPGVNFEIMEVTNTQPGQNPVVTLKISDDDGFPVETSQMSSLSLVMAGPNTDFANVWRDQTIRDNPSTGGVVTHTLSQAIPMDATGSFTIGVEGYRNVTLAPGSTKEVTVRDVGFNQVVPVAVTDATAVARRTVVSMDKCNECHGSLALHGTFRQNVQYCVLCHNANATDVARRPQDQLPTESIHLKTMVHAIHTGEELNRDLTIYGFGGRPHNYNEVLYPGDRRNCDKCHVADGQQLPLTGKLPSVAPRDFIDPMEPAAAACLSCHGSKEAASHALLNTSILGESCSVCHGMEREFSVDRSHAR